MILFEKEINHKKFFFIRGSIIEEKVDAIVNPANENLTHGGGVAGLISRKGGPAIQWESDDKAPVKTGEATHTTAGELPFKYIIHAVGPVWRGGSHNEEKMLRAAVLAALQLADRLGLKSVSLPAISTGIFGFPLQLAINVTTKTIYDFLNCSSSLEEVRLCENSEEKSREIKNVIKNLEE